MLKKIGLFLLTVFQIGLTSCNSQEVMIKAVFQNCGANFEIINTPIPFSYTFTFDYGTVISSEIVNQMKEKLEEVTPNEVLENNEGYKGKRYDILNGFYYNKNKDQPFVHEYKLYKNITLYYILL